MTLKRFTEKELLEGLNAHTAHADELATPLPNEDSFSDPQIQLTNQHGVAALRWILEHQQQFGLSKRDITQLAGAKTEQNMKAWLSEKEPVPERSIRRLGLFLGIYKGLMEVTPSGQEKLAFEWFQRKTHLFPDFPGQSIRGYLVENPTEEALRTACFRVRSLSR